MVANVAEKGYEATTVADLVELSGVSRSAFYKHFSDKQACFLAAIEALVWAGAGSRVRRSSLPDGEPPSDPRRHQDGLRRADRGDRGAAGGGDDVHRRGLCRRAPRRWRCSTARRTPSRSWRPPSCEAMGREGMPSEMVRALIGGVQKVIHKRLYQGKPEELAELAPQLWDWLFLYPPPPGPLRGPRRRVLRPLPFEERQAASNPSERLLRALAAVVAEKGYPETTIADIIERAGTSYRAFYERFESKEDAVVAALDVGSLQMLAAALPAFRMRQGLGGRGAGHPGGDVPLRGAGARVRAAGGGRDVRGGQTGARAARAGDRTDGGPAGSGLRARPRDPADHRRGDRRGAVRALLRPRESRRGPSAWRRWCRGPST